MISSVRRHFEAGSFLRNVTALFSGNLPGHILSLVATPFITRMYAPSEVGIAGLVLVYVGLANSVTTLKYEFAIVSEKSTLQSDRIFQFCLMIALPLSLLTTLVAVGLIFTQSFGFQIVPMSAVPFIFLITYILALFTATKYFFVRREMFTPVAQQSAAYSVFKNILQLLLGFKFANWGSYILAETLGRVASIYFYLHHIPKKIFKFHEISLAKLRVLLHRHRDLPSLSVPSSFINTLAMSLPAAMVAKQFGAESAGYIVLVIRVALGSSSMLGTIIADAYHGRLAKYSRESAEMTFRFFKKTSLFLVALGLVQLTILTLWAPYLFKVFFGEKWIMAGEMARIAASWAFCILVVSTTSRVAFVYKWQKLKLIYDLSVLSLTILVFYLSNRYNFDMVQTMHALTLVNCTCYMIYFALQYRFLQLKVRSELTRV